MSCSYCGTVDCKDPNHRPMKLEEREQYYSTHENYDKPGGGYTTTEERELAAVLRLGAKHSAAWSAPTTGGTAWTEHDVYAVNGELLIGGWQVSLFPSDAEPGKYTLTTNSYTPPSWGAPVKLESAKGFAFYKVIPPEIFDKIRSRPADYVSPRQRAMERSRRRRSR